LHLKPDVVLGDIHRPGRALPEEAGAKIEMVARPLPVSRGRRASQPA